MNSKHPGLYSRLLHFYPAHYREQYALQMAQTLADMLAAAPSETARRRLIVRAYAELPLAIARQHYLILGDAFVTEMPGYIKRNGLISGLLVTPFFLALAANGLSKIIYNRTLYSSWLWSSSALRIWALVLPAIAALFALASWCYYLLDRRAKKPATAWARLANLRQSWPIVLVGLVAVGILILVRFHDSFGCWAQIPAHYLHQSLVCRPN